MGGLAQRREKVFAVSGNGVFSLLPALSPAAFWVLFWQKLRFFPGLVYQLREQEHLPS